MIDRGGEEPGRALASGRWLHRFLLGTALGLGLLFALNRLVDPRAAFGTGWIRPVVVQHRDTRTRLLEDPFTGSPELVVLGSSRAWKVEPDFLEQLTGKAAFVAAVDDARTEDHLAFARWLLSRPAPPTELLVQLDLPAFHGALPASPQLLRNTALAPHLPDDLPLRDRVEPFLDALTHAQLMDSLRALRLSRLPRYPQADVVIGRRGFITYRHRERALREGRFRLAHHVRETIDHFLGVYKDFEELGARRLAYFTDLLELCAARGVAVKVYVPPIHAEQERSLRSRTAYPRLMPRLLRFLRGATRKAGVPFLDATRMDVFGGDPELFYDGIHLREENNRRLLRLLYGKGGG